jgi:hypothetical protein
MKYWREEYIALIREAEAANLVMPAPVGAKQ